MVPTFGCVLSTTITGPTASPEAVRTLAQRAEVLGFDAVWDAVTISFTAPMVFTRTSAPTRSLLSGHPDEIATDLRQYQALGVRNFNINLPGGSVSQQQEVMEQFIRD